MYPDREPPEPREPETWIVLTCRSMHAALSCEQALKSSSPGVELIPVPREIHSNCGVCLRLPQSDEAGIPDALRLRERGGVAGLEAMWRITHTPLPGGRQERRHELIHPFD